MLPGVAKTPPGRDDRLDDARAWEERYVRGHTPWDLGGPPPALLQLLEMLIDESLDVLVPGAGGGRDAVAWAAAGHAVTALDHAPSALRICSQRSRDAGVHVRVVMADVLHLPPDLENGFDAVWEQTCFCALHPESRRDYVSAMSRALRPGGVFYGLFWQHGTGGGPPYDVSEACVRAVFESAFEILSVERVSSTRQRGDEFLARMRRKGWRPSRR
jgi:SAM-dependent methyltransferase